jgi:interferon gamma inducible protein 47
MIFIFLCILIVGVGKIASHDYSNHDTLNIFQRFRTHVGQSGLNNIRDYLEESLNEWKDVSIHIAVTGPTGVGKSAFINTLRGLRDDDPQTGPVGVKEIMKTINSYQDKTNTNIVYWDLPGYGTSKFPRDTYLETVDFNKFDLLVITTASRFSENDCWLVTEAKDHRKPFVLVRNKIDGDLESERHDHPLRSEDDVMESIRNNLMSQLNNPYATIYLLSTRLHHYSTWDFPNLVIDLIQKCPKIKQQAMLFCLHLTAR